MTKNYFKRKNKIRKIFKVKMYGNKILEGAKHSETLPVLEEAFKLVKIRKLS